MILFIVYLSQYLIQISEATGLITSIKGGDVLTAVYDVL